SASMITNKKFCVIAQSIRRQIISKSHAGSFMDALSSPDRAAYSEWDSPRFAERTSGEDRHDLCETPNGPARGAETDANDTITIGCSTLEGDQIMPDFSNAVSIKEGLVETVKGKAKDMASGASEMVGEAKEKV